MKVKKKGRGLNLKKKKGQSVSPPKTSKSSSSPRYSQPTNWKGAYVGSTPKYSQSVNRRGTLSASVLRYFNPTTWKSAYERGIPRYSLFKHRFDINKRYQQKTRPHSSEISEYSGFVKYKKPHYKHMHPSANYLVAKNISSDAIKKGLRKWNIFWIRLNPNKVHSPVMRKVAKKPHYKHMHPSANHLVAKNISNNTIKKGLRKWNIFWIRLNPNKVHPPVRGKVAKKPKFNKKEKDIWNNGRNQKSNTRNDRTKRDVESTSEEESKKNN